MNIERTSKGLANTLFDELEKLKRGDSTPQQSRSVAALANTICAVSRLEMDYARFVSSERSDSRYLDFNARLKIASQSGGWVNG